MSEAVAGGDFGEVRVDRISAAADRALCRSGRVGISGTRMNSSLRRLWGSHLRTVLFAALGGVGGLVYYATVGCRAGGT